VLLLWRCSMHGTVTIWYKYSKPRVFSTLHENIPSIIFMNFSCFLLFRFNYSSTNRKITFFLIHFYTFYTFEHICLHYMRFFFISYPGISSPHRQRLTKRVYSHFFFSNTAWTRRIDENLTSDTAHHALTSSRLENAWRYFCARTASSTYFHISAVGLSLALLDFLFLSPLMTRTMVVRVYKHARVSSE